MRRASRRIAFAKYLFPCPARLDSPESTGIEAAGAARHRADAVEAGTSTAAKAAAPASAETGAAGAAEEDVAGVPGIGTAASSTKAGSAGVKVRALFRGLTKSQSAVSSG